MAPRTSQDVQASEAYSHWLIKAEPETRIEKGIDVKFSIDDLERNWTTTWEGVRNHEAKKYLKSQMKVGHTCLFYASNCKTPGIAGLARVIKEGYPDHNAWDSKHPYYDPKSKSTAPTWFMVEVEFLAKFPHLVPLALLQALAALADTNPQGTLPESLSYLTPAHLDAIASSALIRRGRLSVQPASEGFYEAAKLLGERGGWEEWDGWGKSAKAKAKAKAKGKGEGKAEEAEEAEQGGAREKDEPEAPKPVIKGKKAAPRARNTEKKKAAAKEEHEAADEVSSEEEVTTGGKRRVPGGGPGTRSSKRLRGET